MNPSQRFVALVLLAACGTSFVRAQDTQAPPPEPPRKDEPVRLRPPQNDEQEAEKEMRKLFLKVETRLREIDRLLSDAGAGDTKAFKKDLDSGMNELLKHTQESGKEVMQDIDRILEIAEKMDGRPSSGGGKQGQEEPQSGDSPLDKQGAQSTQREQTPSQPESGKQPGGQKPEQQQNGEQDPRDPRASQDKDPRNTPGKAPTPGATEAQSRPANDADRWGDLPVHARDIFRVEGGSDMPVQYRDWIDSYYRRLNQKKP